MIIRIKRSDAYLRLPRRWFICGIREYHDVKTGEQREEYFFRLRLPSYGMEYQFDNDCWQRSQRVLWWRGNHGFSIYADPEPGSEPIYPEM